MSGGPRRGVTRGYVGALILAATIVAAALLIAVWGMLTLALNRDPVMSPGVSRLVGPALVFLALALFAGSLWLQSLVLLRGQRAPAWGHLIGLAGASFLLWCGGGFLAGMRVEETVLSPFGAAIPAIWLLVGLLYWAVLMRRVYTDRPPPRWPWERDEDAA